MPHLNKHTIGAFLATGCERQLALALATDATTASGGTEAAQLGMPGKQDVRPGIQIITKAGRDWEFKKVQDLEATFPQGTLVASPVLTTNAATGQQAVTSFARQDLTTALTGCSSGQFLVESQFVIPRLFRQEFGCLAGTLANLTFSQVRPDLIQVRDNALIPEGLEVRPDGSVRSFDAQNPRLRLRIIDIKLTAEPTAGYFAEVAYYSIALAAWLSEHQLDSQYLVTADAAVWPGSHEAAAVRGAQAEAAAAGQVLGLPQLLTALELDLESAPFEVFALWLRDFFAQVLPKVVSSLPTWQDLPWHVDNTCRNCDWLGQKWQRRDGTPAWEAGQCIPTAETTDHLSRVAFLTKGSAEALRQQNVPDVATLAGLQPANPAFDSHQALRAGRTVVGARAQTLQTSAGTGPAAGAGTSAVMPGFVDLKIRVSTYFDVGSGITIALGVDGFLMGSQAQQRASRPFPPQVFIVDRKDLTAERDRLIAFLQRLNQILSDAQAAKADASYQVYLWDRAQYEHLTRVIGRHLDAVLDPTNGVQDLAWLFPPEELSPNPATATRRSPITIVRDVVKSLVGAPIAHYYSLLELAKLYQPAHQQPPFTVNPHPMFHDPLSDQIPSERAHEIWTRITPRPARGTRPAQTRDYQQVQADLRSNVILRLHSLRLVVDRLGEDLRGMLKSQAPQIQLGPLGNQTSFASDSHLWYAHCKLNAELSKVDVYTARAMGVSEREAKFQAARLPRQLTDVQAQQYLGGPDPDVLSGRRRVYELGPHSLELKVKDGDFDFCLAPAQDPVFLDQSIYPHQAIPGMPPLQQWQMRWRLDDVTACTVVSFDRTQRRVVVDLENPGMVRALEAAGIVNLTADAVLDHRALEFLTPKVSAALAFIGNPQIAQRAASPLAARATGQARRRTRARTAAITPAAEVLWDSTALASQAAVRDRVAALAALAAVGGLNQTQQQAWTQALFSRLSLIWGPPGTGKSHTLRAIITSAVAAAHAQGEPLRIMVTGPTYTAIDTVVGSDLANALAVAVPGAAVQLNRVRSSSRRDTPQPGVQDVVLNRQAPSPAFAALLDELLNPTAITVVSVAPQQAFNLTKAANIHQSGSDTPGAALFDLVIIDEASQVDVATSTLPLIAMAESASLVVCGDDLQMPPIHAATPPKGLEDMVESIYGYLSKVGGVLPVMLGTNYRSNQDLVDFVKTAGYNSLGAHSPTLSLHLPGGLPTVQPSGWPATLSFSPDYATVLNPAHPATAFVYSEGLASQWNEFEAQATAALVFTLFGNLADQLSGEIPPGGSTPKTTSATPYAADEFFKRGVGVVTPHRAQQSLVITRLIDAFTGVPGVTEDLIRGSVDTVERYQGQQRDVIIATMALGDPDAIADEDEFLLNLRRFNVMASRARAKLVVLATRQVANHMPTEPDVMRDSRLLKSYLGLFCEQTSALALPWFDKLATKVQDGELRWHA